MVADVLELCKLILSTFRDARMMMRLASMRHVIRMRHGENRRAFPYLFLFHIIFFTVLRI